jgi:NAD-dependent DNA ligase
VTLNFKTIRAIRCLYRQILFFVKVPLLLEVRGEVLMLKKDFAKIK